MPYKKKSNVICLPDFALLTGLFLVAFVFSVYAVTWILLAVGLGITVLNVPLGVGVAVGLSYAAIKSQGYSGIAVIPSALTCIVISLLSIVTASSFFDKSYDGQAYHQEAIIRLADTWNPLTRELSEQVPHRLWLTHYPKGPWLEATALYKATNKIECGKATSLLLLAASFFCCLAFLTGLSEYSVVSSFALSLAASFNPVAIYQSLGFYVDGQLSSLLLALLATFGISFKQARSPATPMTFMLIVFAVNVKFTGLIYAGLFAVGFSLALFHASGLRTAVARSKYALAALFAGALVFGFDPYVTNTWTNGHPFHPLLGKERLDTSGFRPEGLQGLNRVEALAVSTFSVSSDTRESSNLKWPFEVSRNEIAQFDRDDIRIGGWGPLFGGLVLVSLAAFTLYLLSRYRDAEYAKWVLFVAFGLFFTAIVNPEAWWARYTPQLYFMPMLLVLPLCVTTIRWGMWGGALVLLIAFANSSAVALPYLRGNYSTSTTIKATLSGIKDKGKPISVYFGPFSSNRVRLTEAGIVYREVATSDELSCDKPVNLPGSLGRVKFCLY